MNTRARSSETFEASTLCTTAIFLLLTNQLSFLDKLPYGAFINHSLLLSSLSYLPDMSYKEGGF